MTDWNFATSIGGISKLDSFFFFVNRRKLET